MQHTVETVVRKERKKSKINNLSLHFSKPEKIKSKPKKF